MSRTATKLRIEFPLAVHEQVRFGSNSSQTQAQLKRAQHEAVAVGDAFVVNFWIEYADLDALDELAQSESGDGLSMLVNGERVAIEIAEVSDAAQCQMEAIEFYDSALKEMIATLSDEAFLAALEELMVPADQRKAQQQIAALLNSDAAADSEEKDPNIDTTDDV